VSTIIVSTEKYDSYLKDCLKIVDKINGKKVQFDVNENGLEFLNVTINGLQKTIIYNEIRNDIEEHFRSKSIMNTSSNIQSFFQNFLNNSTSFNNNVERHQSKIGNSEIDLNRELVQSLCLSKKMKWYGWFNHPIFFNSFRSKWFHALGRRVENPLQ